MDVAEQTPLVAIRCITYNHEPYIRDALEGFVMQKTNFPFIAIVHDDASTDGTAGIIREYAEKYPDLIKPIYETENQYNKYNGTLIRIMDKACLSSGAKYMAVCEGDDYWTDPFKLQKQVDFLESHPDYSMVFADVRLEYETGLTERTFGFESRTYPPLEIYEGWIPTPTVIVRTAVLNSDCYNALLHRIKRHVFSDKTLFMACAASGKIYGMSDVVGNYRRLSTGAAQYLVKYPYRYFKNRIAISGYFGSQFKKVDAERFKGYFLYAIARIFVDFPENFKFMCRLFWLAPWTCIKECRNIPMRFTRKFFHK